MGKIGNRPLWVFYLSIGIRAIHQVGAAVFLTSFLLEEIVATPRFYLMLTTISGLVLVVTEGMRHRQLYRELSGVCTIIKLLLIGAAFHNYLPLPETIVLGFMLASIGAHTPKFIRHRLLF